MKTNILPLSDKQYYQLMNLSERTQSFLCSDTATFIELLNIAGSSSNDLCIKRQINEYKQKYFPYGFRENKNEFNWTQLAMVRKKKNPIFGSRSFTYKEIEKVAFIRVVRACRDYMLSAMNEDDTNQLVNKIVLSRKMTF